jgi:hypothetical protein
MKTVPHERFSSTIVFITIPTKLQEPDTAGSSQAGRKPPRI